MKPIKVFTDLIKIAPNRRSAHYINRFQPNICNGCQLQLQMNDTNNVLIN